MTLRADSFRVSYLSMPNQDVILEDPLFPFFDPPSTYSLVCAGVVEGPGTARRFGLFMSS